MVSLFYINLVIIGSYFVQNLKGLFVPMAAMQNPFFSEEEDSSVLTCTDGFAYTISPPTIVICYKVHINSTSCTSSLIYSTPSLL